MESKDKSITWLGCTLFVVLGLIIMSFNIAHSEAVFRIEMDNNTLEAVNNMDEVVEEIEISNRRAACYKGCQFVTQPIYGLAVDNQTFRINQYDQCVIMCESRYIGGN